MSTDPNGIDKKMFYLHFKELSDVQDYTTAWQHFYNRSLAKVIF